MKIHEINEKLNKIKFEEESKAAVLELIDEKIEGDMEKVINRIDVLSNAIAGIKDEFKAQNQSLRNELKTENQSLKNTLNDKVNIILWVIGIAATVIGYLLYKK